ncbi:trypsin-like serine protease [Streptomyces sp. NPDC001678]|uniref:trypsin-like serine protease n=1 Tax=Streptomyces sp. NPDC001678 TaxID=3364599 RepID=UPI0036C33135
MLGRRVRARWAAGLLGVAISGGGLAATPASAEEAKDSESQYSYMAKLDIGGQRSCTGTRVDFWHVLTAASCFADDPAKGFHIPAGPPKLKTTVILGGLGGADLSEKPARVEAINLVPRNDRDVVMVELARNEGYLSPGTVPAKSDVTLARFGHAQDGEKPHRLQTFPVRLGQVKDTTVDLIGRKPTDTAVCEGDTGAPVHKQTSEGLELVAINGPSWQGGCQNVPATRVDDIQDWIANAGSNFVLSERSWDDARLLTPGYFMGQPGRSRMDLFVIWKDGSASLFQGNGNSDTGAPFAAEHKLAGSGSRWKDARAITGGRFTDQGGAYGTDGLVVRWADGGVTEYTYLDQFGTHDEKTLRAGGGDNPFWKNARLITTGRFTENGLRDDLLVVWENGSTSMYTDIHSKGLSGWKQLSKADKTWTDATQIGTGAWGHSWEVDRVLVQFSNGQTTMYPLPDGDKGWEFPNNIREAGSAWKNVRLMTTGVFADAQYRDPTDALIIWNNGNVGLWPRIDREGTHGGIELVVNGSPR